MDFSLLDISMLLLFHWIADFVFQKESWAVNKWNSFKALSTHVFMYTTLFTGLVLIYLFFTKYPPNEYIFEMFGIFYVLLFLQHLIVDFISSKITHKLAEKKKYYTGIPTFGFFSIIGLDQLIHTVLFLITFHAIFYGI